jgi:transposase
MPEAGRASIRLRRVTDAVLYVVKTGCQWRQLPIDFPPWQTVHQQFRAWRLQGRWERVTKALREQGRKTGGRSSTPTVAIIDSQSAKTTGKGGRAATTQAKRSRAASATSPSIRKATLADWA